MWALSLQCRTNAAVTTMIGPGGRKVSVGASGAGGTRSTGGVSADDDVRVASVR